MSEEQFKIWKQVEAKGLEKLGNIEKALLAKEGFEEAHKDYCDFVDRLAETTGLTTGELDRHFTTLLDIYGTTLVLTAAERKDLRHRTEPKSQDDPEVVQKKKDQDEFKKRLAEFRSKWGRYNNEC